MLRMVMVAGLLAGIGAAVPAAADNAMQVCGARYQAAKAARTLPAGQTWSQFLAGCRASLPKAPVPVAIAKSATSAPGKMAAAPRIAGQPSAAQVAARSRQKQCSASYRADKAANKLAGQSWPRYYSGCSARLKA